MSSELHAIVMRLTAAGRGILAVDETPGTIAARLEQVGVVATPEIRGAYRELLVNTPDLADWIGGVILQDETFRQRTSTGRTFPEEIAARAMIAGIKVDTGAKPLANAPGETITEGLDGLRDRVAEYRELGARFAKWRAVYRIGESTPTERAVRGHGHTPAPYAALCQEGGLVPVVEPEVLLDGDHSIERCEDVTRRVLRAVFAELAEQDVSLVGMILKASMVVSGSTHAVRPGAKEVAAATVDVLRDVVPPAVPAIAFLSGGQTAVEATEHLQAINELGPLAWTLTFSFGRALQDPALAAWRGDHARLAAAQQALARRARCNAAASTGTYAAALEADGT